MPQFFEPGIGIVFEVSALKSRNTKAEARRIFFLHAKPLDLAGCVILAGDTRATQRKEANRYLVAAYGANLKPDLVRSWFEPADDPGLATPDERFIEKPDLNTEPIEVIGKVLPSGHYETPGWNKVDHLICRETGWCYKPGRIPAAIPTEMRRELERWAIRNPLESGARTTSGPVKKPPKAVRPSLLDRIRNLFRKGPRQ